MTVDIALLGYGRFGQAFATLLQVSGYSLRVFDPVANVPDELRATSLAAATLGARWVVLAMPVGNFRTVLDELGPALTPEQVVFDVGSVKMLPLHLLDVALGDRVAFVGTHPLFGPMSLALAELPLRTVVCPSPRHPAAAESVSHLFRSLGCEVLEQSAEQHDHIMADTHALAFFLAKGLLDIGAGEGAPYAPPSFYAMARTVESVRSDAGQLFLTIERDNPFAQAARTRLLETLGAVHRALNEPPTIRPAHDAPQLVISNAQHPPPELRETRDLIDDLDHELLRLLRRRATLAQRAAQAKSAHGRTMIDRQRENALLEQRRQWAQTLGLDVDSVESIFHAVLRFSHHVQMQKMPPESS